MNRVLAMLSPERASSPVAADPPQKALGS
jgi:hypothetical protein